MTNPHHQSTALLEIACFDAQSATTAFHAGADRIELCHGKDSGGTTPSISSLRQVKQHVTTIPVYVMIRPRGGDFVYSHTEFEQMNSEIDTFRDRVDGFVFGILTGEGRVDVQRTAELVRRAQGLPCTFHRAFDEVKDLGTALEDVVETGCEAILSSGGKRDAQAGATVLAGLVHQARGRIQILPGGGVRATNIRELREVTGADVFHSSGMLAGRTEADAEEIAAMKALLCAERADGVSEAAVNGSSSGHGSGDEEGMPAEMHASAVSIG